MKPRSKHYYSELFFFTPNINTYQQKFSDGKSGIFWFFLVHHQHGIERNGKKKGGAVDYVIFREYICLYCTLMGHGAFPEFLWPYIAIPLGGLSYSLYLLA